MGGRAGESLEGKGRREGLRGRVWGLGNRIRLPHPVQLPNTRLACGSELVGCAAMMPNYSRGS